MTSQATRMDLLLNTQICNMGLQVMNILNPDMVAAFVAVIALCWTFWTARERWRQKQFEVLQQSFELLQRINETALQSPEHLRAALLSANPNEAFDENSARELYFHYMRINRIFRAYEYWNGGFITTAQRDRVVHSHISSLRPVTHKLDAMLKRGYPQDFADYIAQELQRNAVDLPVIEGVVKGPVASKI